MGDFIEEALSGPTVFEREEVFSFDWTPDELVDREEAKGFLANLFKPAIVDGTPVTCRITGRVGTGKTALAKHFCARLQPAGDKRGRTFEHAHVNCRRRNSAAKTLHRIVTHFDRGFPDRGFSVTEMLDSLRKWITKSEVHLVVILDEVDELIAKSGSDLLYNLTRFHEEPPEQGNLSLVLVSQHDVIDQLDDATRSTMRRTNRLDLDPYTRPELVEIVEQRAELGLRPGTLEPPATDQISDIASDDGDARYAIELLHMAGKAADSQGDEKITPEHVRHAKADTRRTVWADQVLDLPLQKKLTLLAVARNLEGGGSYTTTGDVEETYQVLCESAGEDPRGHTQFWTYLKELSTVGLIDTQKSGEGVVGSTTLISLPDVPARQLVDILGDDMDL